MKQMKNTKKCMINRDDLNVRGPLAILNDDKTVSA